MRKWEYKKILREMDFTGVNTMMLGPGYGPVHKWKDYLDDQDTRKYTDEMSRLEQLGDEGWELVSVLFARVGEKHTYTYYLKRAIE